MYALIMAGGTGSRLNMGEKPLVRVGDQPMIAYVIDAFRNAGCEPVVVLSSRTPYTANWCRVQGIPCVTTAGEGYVEDLAEAVTAMGVEGPVFSCAADIPCITADLVTLILSKYLEAGTEACSVWVPLALAGEKGCRTRYKQCVDGVEACPAGVNILRGDRISREQEETALLIADSRLAFNINTRAELELVTDHLHRQAP